jgi:hypothetical protein
MPNMPHGAKRTCCSGYKIFPYPRSDPSSAPTTLIRRVEPASGKKLKSSQLSSSTAYAPEWRVVQPLWEGGNDHSEIVADTMVQSCNMTSADCSAATAFSRAFRCLGPLHDQAELLERCTANAKRGVAAHQKTSKCRIPPLSLGTCSSKAAASATQRH